MNELYDSVDYKNLKLEYVGPTKDVSFYECMDSIKLFNKIKNNYIKFSEVKNKQNEFLKKVTNIKTGKNTDKQKKWLIILINWTILGKKLLIFLETLLSCKIKWK